MEWLKNLKAGDEVVLCGRYSRKEIATVERATAKAIFCSGMKFSKLDGWEIRPRGSNQLLNDQIVEATPAQRAEIETTARRTAAIYIIQNATTGNRIYVYTTDQLERIAAILAEPRQ